MLRSLKCWPKRRDKYYLTLEVLDQNDYKCLGGCFDSRYTFTDVFNELEVPVEGRTGCWGIQGVPAVRAEGSNSDSTRYWLDLSTKISDAGNYVNLSERLRLSIQWWDDSLRGHPEWIHEFRSNVERRLITPPGELCNVRQNIAIDPGNDCQRYHLKDCEFEIIEVGELFRNGKGGYNCRLLVGPEDVSLILGNTYSPELSLSWARVGCISTKAEGVVIKTARRTKPEEELIFKPKVWDHNYTALRLKHRQSCSREPPQQTRTCQTKHGHDGGSAQTSSQHEGGGVQDSTRCCDDSTADSSSGPITNPDEPCSIRGNNRNNVDTPGLDTSQSQSTARRETGTQTLGTAQPDQDDTPPSFSSSSYGTIGSFPGQGEEGDLPNGSLTDNVERTDHQDTDSTARLLKEYNRDRNGSTTVGDAVGGTSAFSGSMHSPQLDVVQKNRKATDQILSFKNQTGSNRRISGVQNAGENREFAKKRKNLELDGRSSESSFAVPLDRFTSRQIDAVQEPEEASGPLYGYVQGSSIPRSHDSTTSSRRQSREREDEKGGRERQRANLELDGASLQPSLSSTTNPVKRKGDADKETSSSSESADSMVANASGSTPCHSSGASGLSQGTAYTREGPNLAFDGRIGERAVSPEPSLNESASTGTHLSSDASSQSRGESIVQGAASATMSAYSVHGYSIPSMMSGPRTNQDFTNEWRSSLELHAHL